MMKYTITNCRNEFIKCVSVSEELVDSVTEQLAALPYVDSAASSKVGKTRIHVFLSDLYEPSDLKDMEGVIKQAVKDAL